MTQQVLPVFKTHSSSPQTTPECMLQVVYSYLRQFYFITDMKPSAEVLQFLQLRGQKMFYS